MVLSIMTLIIITFSITVKAEKKSIFLYLCKILELRSIEEHVLDTNARKQLSQAATDV
jgi:hypothetical protein